MTRREPELWLVGIPGAPLVPQSWDPGAPWQAVVFESDARGQVSSRVATSSEAPLWHVSGRSPKSLDVSDSARNIIGAIVGARHGWVDESVSTSVTEDFTLSELPLLRGTRTVLQSLNFDGSAKVSSVAEIARSRLLSSEGGASALLDLTVAIEQWWPKRLYSPLWHAQQASSLEQVARAIVEEYNMLLGGSLDAVWIDAVLSRQSWGVPRATLQQIGDQVGVTRERVRQILGRFDTLIGTRVWPVPGALAAAIESVVAHSPDSVPSALQATGMSVDDDWTAEEIAQLLEWFGQENAAAVLRQTWQVFEEAARITPEIARAIRSARSSLGFLNAGAILQPNGSPMDPDLVVEMASKLYPRCFRSGNWLLVGTRESTSAESTLARQFWVEPILDIDEIMEGLERRRTARQADQLPPRDVVVELLVQSGALMPSGNSWTGPSVSAEPGSIESWLVKSLRAASGEVLHKDVLLRQAQEDGLNVVSVHQFVAYSPVVRAVEDTGLIRLVGHSVTPEAVVFAARVADALRINTECDWRQVQPGQLELSILVGTSLFSSSILNVDAALAGLWPQNGAEIQCVCDRQFQGRINRYGTGNQLIGWMTLLSHLNQEHGFREGDVLGLAVLGDTVQVTSLL